MLQEQPQLETRKKLAYPKNRQPQFPLLITTSIHNKDKLNKEINGLRAATSTATNNNEKSQ